MNFELMKQVAVGIDKTYAKSAKPFDQSLYMISIGAEIMGDHSKKGGICRALASEFLVHNFKKRNPDAQKGLDELYEALELEDDGDHFFQKFQSGTKAEGKGGKRAQLISKAQVTGEPADNTETGKTDGIAKTVAFLSNGQMKLKGKSDVLRANIVKLKPEAPSYIYISTGAHAIAVAAVKSKEQTKFKFFDPNYGQVVFSQAMALVRFMHWYFTALDAQHLELYEFA